MDFRYGRDSLVAEDEPGLAPFAVAQEPVDVGATDRRGVDLEEHIAGAGAGLGDVLDLDPARTRIDEGSHGPKSITGRLEAARTPGDQALG